MTSKNGIPIASYLENEEEYESFSTLSATILGASEVIFSAFKKDNPEDIFVKSGESVLYIKEMMPDAVISALGSPDEKEKLAKNIDKISEQVQKIRDITSNMEAQ